MFKDFQNVNIQVFNILGFEYPCMPKALFPSRSQESLHKSVLDALVRKNAVRILFFKGFEVQHVVANEIQ